MAPVFLKTSPPRQQSLDEDRRKGHGDRQLPSRSSRIRRIIDDLFFAL